MNNGKLDSNNSEAANSGSLQVWFDANNTNGYQQKAAQQLMMTMVLLIILVESTTLVQPDIIWRGKDLDIRL